TPITTSGQPFCSKPLQPRKQRLNVSADKWPFPEHLSDAPIRNRGIRIDNRWGGMSLNGQDSRDQAPEDPDDTPDTPLDEPRPPRVEDPPPQSDSNGPYVVHPDRQRRRSGEYRRTYRTTRVRDRVSRGAAGDR